MKPPRCPSQNLLEERGIAPPKEVVRMDCENMPKCTFLSTPAPNKEVELATAGFIRLYCKGGMRERCVRRTVARSLGDPARVPANMMPNGLPISGTDDSKWPSEVRILAVRRFRI